MEKEYFTKFGLKLCADHAVLFQLKDIVFDSRTLLKCMFGCKDWGKGLTCPPRKGSLLPWEYKKILNNYTWGVIIHSKDKRISQKVSYEIERDAFLKGYYFAFSLSDCALCKKCAGYKNESCINPSKSRPAFHSVGIDVYKTVHQFGLPLKPLKEGEDDKQNWYSAVFIE